ncbi:TonB-dependent receptor [Hellea sp.]|nr:TonB-dependent receptor [Hellea sp.]
MTAYFEGTFAARETQTNTAGQGAIELPESYALNQFGGQSTLFFQSQNVTDTNVSQYRFVAGLKGKLPFLENAGLDNWEYDGYLSYSRSSGQDSVRGVPFLPRLEQTLANTVVDADGNATCTPRSIPGEGQNVSCRPLDFFQQSFLFSGRFEDDLDTNYLFPNRLTDTVVKQNIASGYVSGDLFDIPTGGTIVMGIGGEYREDIIETRTSLAGDFLGFFDDPGSNGRRTLTEAFGEIEFPLVTDKPLVHELTLNLSGRYTDESNFGSEETYSVKGVYAPTDWLSFRGSYGTSFRAPNLGEQFGGAVVGFANPNDPCRVPGVAVPFTDFDNDPTTDETRNYNPDLDPRDPNIIANCLSGGGPFGLAATDPFSLGVRGLNGSSPVFLGAPTQVASGSNPDLDAETSDALSLGGTFIQPWIDEIDFQLAVNYFRIEVNDEVNQLTAATIVNRCYNSVGLSDPTCEFITRDARDPNIAESGEVSFVSALNQNLGRQIVRGIDINGEFGFDFSTPWSETDVDYNLIVRGTRSIQQDVEEATVDGVNINDNLGEYGSPKWRLNLTNSLRWKDFGFLFQSRYLSSAIEDNADPFDQITTGFSLCVQTLGAFDANGDFNCFQDDDLNDYWVHNTSMSYSKDSYVLRVGVNNVFDTDPPLTDNNDLGFLGGLGFDTGGRTYFVNATKRF